MDSELFYAVTTDNLDGLKELGKRLSVDDQRTPTKSTVLHLACQYGSIKCVREILTVHGSLLLKINSRGETALHLAAREAPYNVVEALINTAKSALEPNNIQNTTSTVVQSLIRTRDQHVELETALHQAVRYNRYQVVQLLVKEDPSLSYPQNKHNVTPLYLASTRCYTRIIKTILDGCDSPTFGGPEGRTALHGALLDYGGCRYTKDCVKLLLAKNRHLIKVADNYGWTAFHYVAFNDLYTIVEYLVGADKSMGYHTDKKNKRTALHVAAYKGNVRVMEKLVEYYPDVWDMVDGNGQNILHIAVKKDRKGIINFIVLKGWETSNALLIQRDNEGNTPLHLIAKLGRYVPEFMVREFGRKIDWEVLDQNNLTPLDVLHSGHKVDSIIDQAMLKKGLINVQVNKHWQLWQTLKEPDVETGEHVFHEQQVKQYNDEFRTHMIVAALITTVALTAGFRHARWL